MDEDVKKEIGRFRFGVIADLVGRKLTRGERQRILREKSQAQWDIPHSTRTRISRSTILYWLRRYEESGGRLESLYPDHRSDKDTSRALEAETARALIRLKQEYRGATLPAVLREAKRRGVVPAQFRVSKATLYRFFKRQGLDEDASPPVDRRRFEAELPNDIWQSDAMHAVKALVNGKLRKTYLFAFIDDMSRFIPHAEFYLNEGIESYTDALRQALAKRGLPRKLYVDNGPAFASCHLGHVTASLGIALVHSKPYQPEGRGKMERWFRTVRERFLSLTPDGLPLSVLNRYLAEWIESDYHTAVHASTGEAPMVRYLRHVHLIREAPKDLDDYFRKRALRRVAKDRTVALNGRLYEAPLELIGKQVTLLYHDHDPGRIEIHLAGESVGRLVPLDLQLNCRIRRRHLLEILPKDSPPRPSQKPVMTTGKLFGPASSDDQL